MGRAMGGAVVNQSDRSRRVDCSVRMSSWFTDLLAIFEERAWRLEQSS